MHVTNGGFRVRLVLPAAMAMALLGSALATALLGPIAGIKSLYAFVGLLLAGGVLYASRADVLLSPSRSQWKTRRRIAGKGVFAVLGVGVLAVLAAIGSATVDPTTVRSVVLLLCLPIGYLLLTLQIRWRASPSWILPQLLGLFSFAPVLQYATTDFYFDRGDTTAHVYWVDLVVADGTWRAIPAPSHYTHFPGLHTLLAAVNKLADISSYDAYILVGIIAFATFVCVAYCVGRTLFRDRQLGLFVALATAVLTPTATHTTYFFPQAFATVLVFILLLASFRAASVPGSAKAYHVLSVLLVPVLLFSHHLTVVLFVPVFLAFGVFPPVLRRVRRAGFIRIGDVDIARPRLISLAVYVLGSAAYWRYHDIFLGALINALEVIFQGPLLAGDDGTAVVPLVVLGEPLPNSSVGEAAVSLLSPGGLSQIALVCVLALGFVVIATDPQRYWYPVVFVILGLIGATQLIRHPFPIPGLNRMGLMLTLFVGIVVGIGFNRYLSVARVPGRASIAPLVIVVLLATSVAVVAGNDLYLLHSGPGLWETQPTPEIQREFTDEEMRGLELASVFIERSSASAATDWHSRIGMKRFGSEVEMMQVTEDGIETEEDLLLYRQRWNDHSLQLIPEELSFVRVVVREEWKAELVASENKVYTTGEVGMLADRPEAHGLNRTDEHPDESANEAIEPG